MKLKLGILVSLIILTILVVPAKAVFSPEVQKDLIQEKISQMQDRTAQAIEKIDLKIEELLKGRYVGDEIVVKFKGEKEHFRVIKVPDGKVGEKIREYLNRGDVEFVEPNYIAEAFLVPNDQYYSYQWHFDNSVYGGINMEEAWDVSTGSGVTVAIIDTGIAYENYSQYQKAPDLANTCFVAGYDFVYNDTHPNDDSGHGTHVAGTVAQSTNNNIGVAGIAFNSCLMPVKVLDKNGNGSYTTVANGIYFAIDHGAQVINLSLGGSQPSSVLENAVAYAYNNGVTVVAAAGNDGSSSISYPAAYNNYVIAVGATRYDETLAYYSNYGPSLDLVAPGGDLNVDQNNDGYKDGILQNTFQKNGGQTQWGYYFMQGTSMATPHVSGVAALLISHGNATNNDQVRTALQETTEDLGTSGWDETYGWGLIDAAAALNWSSGTTTVCSSDADCDDGNICTTDSCINPGTPDAYCFYNNATDGTVCDDNSFCTINDVCTTGICNGTARDCNDNNECTVDSCNEGTDVCDHANVADNTSCTDGVCCSGICKTGITNCSTGVLCWKGSNIYLNQNKNQAKKFCKCAEGTYGYNSYSNVSGRKTAYKYLDAGNNENWNVSSMSTSNPIYKVKCLDGVEYLTNQDYYY